MANRLVEVRPLPPTAVFSCDCLPVKFFLQAFLFAFFPLFKQAGLALQPIKIATHEKNTFVPVIYNPFFDQSTGSICKSPEIFF